MDPEETIPNSFFESFWGTTDEALNPEVLEFYKKFLESDEKLKAEIASYEIVRTPNKHTVYVIKVTTNSFEYSVRKRFSEFDQLRNELRDKYQELELQKMTFPAKTYFSYGTDSETIQKRRRLFDQFLQHLVLYCKTTPIIEFFEFIELRKKYTELSSIPNSAPIWDKLYYSTNTQEITKLLQYLDQLNRNSEETSKTLKEMENFYITNKPKISPDVIKALLVGKSKSQGLIHFCGKIDPQTGSHLVCTVGLKFLTMLMDHQSCQDAEAFSVIFGSLDPKLVNFLCLPEHIEGKRHCKSPAFKLIDIYLSRNLKVSLNDLLKTPIACQEYENWKLSNKTTFLTAERVSLPGKAQEIPESLPDFSLSPHSPTMGSFDDYATYLDRISTDEQKLEWTKLPSDNDIKIKYHRAKYLSITLHSKKDLDVCAQHIEKGIDYRIFCEEAKKVKEIECDIYIYQIKVRFEQPGEKTHAIFVSEKRIEDNPGDKIVILERPSNKFSPFFNSAEVRAKRFSNIVISHDDRRTDGKNTKIKMLVKNLDEISKLLQNYLLQENGRFIYEGCRKLLEDIEN